MSTNFCCRTVVRKVSAYEFCKENSKGCLPKKKIAEKETLVHMGGRGVKKSPFFGSSKRGHILMGGGVKSFCLMSHVHFCASVSTQFVAFEALHYEYFLT